MQDNIHNLCLICYEHYYGLVLVNHCYLAEYNYNNTVTQSKEPNNGYNNYNDSNNYHNNNGNPGERGRRHRSRSREPNNAYNDNNNNYDNRY